MKNPKKILILFSIIVLIIILFFAFNKSQQNKINVNSKDKSTENAEELDKNAGKTSEVDATTVLDKSGDNVTNVDNKDTEEKDTGKQETNKTTEVISSKEDVTVFVEAAAFGSTAELLIDSGSFSDSYKYYQFFLGNKPISNIENITKNETTIFPAQEAGSEVVLKILNENNKVLKELKIKLKDKK